MAAYSRLILGPLGPSHGQAVVMFLFIISLASPPREAAAQSFGPPPEFGSGQPRVDIKMAVVMVLLVAVFFILGFLSVYTRQCAQHRFRGRADLGFGHSPSGWAAARGLNPDVIDTFPTFVYSTVKGHKIGKGALECAVCLNEFEDNETLRLIPKCDHVFHPDCIDAWLVSHSTCPVCRANLAPQPGEFHHTLADVLHPLQDPVGPDFISVDVEEPRANREAAEPVGDDESPEIRLIEGEKSSRPPRSRSTGFGPPRSRSTGFGPPRSRSAGRRFGGIFSRSHSTGHLLGRQGESHERFTLRLPEDVRSQLVNSTLQLARAKSTGAGLPRVGSARRGYRSGSRKDGSSYYYERFDPEATADRWVFSVVPLFISRTGSVRSGSKGTSGDDVANRSKAGSSETERPPSDRLFIGKDDIAERSSDPLRPGNNV